VVLNYLIDNNIPHNILMADEGMTMYIIPRKFDLLIENINFFTSFETLCGFIKCQSRQAYESMDEAELVKKLENCVSYGEKEFNDLKNTLV
jgi:hypothetical protein